MVSECKRDAVERIGISISKCLWIILKVVLCQKCLLLAEQAAIHVAMAPATAVVLLESVVLSLQSVSFTLGQLVSDHRLSETLRDVSVLLQLCCLLFSSFRFSFSAHLLLRSERLFDFSSDQNLAVCKACLAECSKGSEKAERVQLDFSGKQRGGDEETGSDIREGHLADEREARQRSSGENDRDSSEDVLEGACALDVEEDAEEVVQKGHSRDRERERQSGLCIRCV